MIDANFSAGRWMGGCYGWHKSYQNVCNVDYYDFCRRYKYGSESQTKAFPLSLKINLDIYVYVWLLYARFCGKYNVYFCASMNTFVHHKPKATRLVIENGGETPKGGRLIWASFRNRSLISACFTQVICQVQIITYIQKHTYSTEHTYLYFCMHYPNKIGRFICLAILYVYREGTKKTLPKNQKE